MILKDVFTDDPSNWPPIVDADLVEGILWELGEFERAQDPQLVREMVQVASSTSGRFDEEALANALTSDIQDWKVGSEENISTLFCDVFGRNDDGSSIQRSSMPKEEDEPKSDPQQLELGEVAATSQAVDAEAQSGDDGDTRDENDDENREIIKTDHSNIEYGISSCFLSAFVHLDLTLPVYHHSLVVDMHSSIALMVLTWIFYFFTVVSYAALLRSLVTPPCQRAGGKTGFGCQFADVLWTW
jgi:hypothetical protein